jgi:nucleotide-binding universal stress UspA family protein
MIDRILFPVDFSPACSGMAAYVKRAAEMFGSRVTLVHVCDLTSNNGYELIARTMREIAEEHQAVAEDQLMSFLASDFPPDACSRILRFGEAAAEIAEVARTGGFDLVIMPTHAGRFRRMLLGSTTAKVLNDADCPVMTTQHAEAVIPRPLEHRVWVCAIGLSQDSERVLRVASDAAVTAGAKLSLVHAADESAEPTARPRLEALVRAVGCEAQVHVVTGPVKQALLEEARRAAADALIVGRTPRSGALGRMRDLTYSLVRDSPFPVLSV